MNVLAKQMKNKALIMLDMGSTHTLMSRKLVKIVKPQMKERTRKIKIITVNGQMDELEDVCIITIGKEKTYGVELLICNNYLK